MIAKLPCAGKPDDEWLLRVQFGVQIDEREQTRSGIVKALCLAKQTAIRTNCSTEQKEGGRGGKKSFIVSSGWFADKRLLLSGCCLRVSASSTRATRGERASEWTGTEEEEGEKKHFEASRRKKRRQRQARGREVKLTSLLSEMESGIVCSQHQSWLFCAICLYWPIILEFDNAALVSPLFPPSSISLFLPSANRWNNEVTPAQYSRRDITVDGRDPTVRNGWKLSLPHFFLSPPHKFPSGRGVECLSASLH